MEKINSYYILKTQATKSRSNYKFYKIGEADKQARPQDLCNKYTKTDNRVNSTAVQLDYQPLPHNGKKRLNDKTIHKALDKNIFRKVDPNLIEGIFGETDGYDEFFEVLDPSLTDNDIIRIVAETVTNLAKDSTNFTAKLSRVPVITLDYKQQKHLVDNNIVSQIENKYNIDFSKVQNKNILLIGQFLPDWVSTFALNNNVVIWHDTKDQAVIYGYEKLNSKIKYVNELEEIIDMNIKFDNIISNPPYGSLGANITDTIRENVDYNEFVNLLPANDYKRNKNKDLFNYQSNMEAINNGFADAIVTTHCALIHKNKVNSLTETEFIISRFTDKALEKYFNETANRKHYAIDAARRPQFSSITVEDNTNTILFGIRDMAHKHLSYDKQCDTYLWNVLKAIDINKLKSNIGLKGSPNTQASHYFLVFNSQVEKDNFAKFMYSINGFRFLSKIFTALNTDSMIALGLFLPKVDWSRSWTVEEILADYGYTSTEIKEVIDDLDNFKGMD